MHASQSGRKVHIDLTLPHRLLSPTIPLEHTISPLRPHPTHAEAAEGGR
jgi:hypothetical protein